VKIKTHLSKDLSKKQTGRGRERRVEGRKQSFKAGFRQASRRRDGRSIEFNPAAGAALKEQDRLPFFHRGGRQILSKSGKSPEIEKGVFCCFLAAGRRFRV
jgi:hypothetical protein